MDEFSIRNAAEEDIPKLLLLEKRVQKDPWTLQSFREEFGKPHVFTYVVTDDETDEEVLAYVSWSLITDEVEIRNLAVDKPYQKLGFGGKLLRSALDQAIRSGAKKAFLEVRKSNNPAVALYQKNGFTISGVRKGYYHDGEDAYTLKAELSDAPRSEFDSD